MSRDIRELDKRTLEFNKSIRCGHIGYLRSLRFSYLYLALRIVQHLSSNLQFQTPVPSISSLCTIAALPPAYYPRLVWIPKLLRAQRACNAEASASGWSSPLK